MKILIVCFLNLFISVINTSESNSSLLESKSYGGECSNSNNKQLNTPVSNIVFIKRREDEEYYQFCTAAMLNSQFCIALARCVLQIMEFYGKYGRGRKETSRMEKLSEGLKNVVSITDKPEYVVWARYAANTDGGKNYGIKKMYCPKADYINAPEDFGILKLKNAVQSEGLINLPLTGPIWNVIGKVGKYMPHPDGKIVTLLLELRMKKQDQCKEYNKFGNFSEYNFCAISPDKSNINNHPEIDLGSPIFHFNRLIGLASSFEFNNKPPYSKYSIVFKFESYINSIIGKYKTQT